MVLAHPVLSNRILILTLRFMYLRKKKVAVIPVLQRYKPQFYIRTTDVTGSIELAQGVEMVMPGDNTVMKIKLIYPVAIEVGLRFAIREGGRTVGAGSVSKIIE